MKSANLYYPILACISIGIVLISNITTSVPVVIGPINTDGAFYLFPLAYVVDDVICEVYGFRATRSVIYTGFGILLFSALCFHISAALPHGHDYLAAPAVNAFSQVAVASLRFIIAGLSGYLCGQLVNSFVIAKVKKKTGEKKLWLRLVLATLSSEFLDTMIFCLIAAPALGYITFGEIANYTIAGFIWKSLIEIAVMPITYTACSYLKRHDETYLAERD